jgi:hypothetical protein
VSPASFASDMGVPAVNSGRGPLFEGEAASPRQSAPYGNPFRALRDRPLNGTPIPQN